MRSSAATGGRPALRCGSVQRCAADQSSAARPAAGASAAACRARRTTSASAGAGGPAGRRQERSIRQPQLGPPCLATKDLELVAEHDDLEFLEVLRAKAQQDQREHPPQSEVEKRRQQLRRSLRGQDRATLGRVRQRAHFSRAQGGELRRFAKRRPALRTAQAWMWTATAAISTIRTVLHSSVWRGSTGSPAFRSHAE